MDIAVAKTKLSRSKTQSNSCILTYTPSRKRLHTNSEIFYFIFILPSIFDHMILIVKSTIFKFHLVATATQSPHTHTNKTTTTVKNQQ